MPWRRNGPEAELSFHFKKKAVIAAALGLFVFVFLFIAARDLLHRCACVHSALRVRSRATRKFSALAQLPAPGETGTHKRRIAR